MLDYITACNKTFTFKKVETNQVRKLLKALDVNKAIGDDSIHPKCLVDGAVRLAPLIRHIFNTCVETGVFPDKLKLARVAPLFKSGDPELAVNYRPVSILNQLSKIFERLILLQLSEYLYTNKIITNSQYGFLKKVSTKHALIDFHEKLINMLDQKVLFSLCIY